MHRLALVIVLTLLGLTVSCGAPTQLPPAVPEAAPASVARAARYELVPQHAVRTEDASAWDPVTRTRVIASATGHIVLVDGDTGLVRAVNRFARRTEGVMLVVAAGRAMLYFDADDETQYVAPVDLDSGDVLDTQQLAQDTNVEASADRTTLATWYRGAAATTITIERAAPGEEPSSCELAVDEREDERTPALALSPDGKRLVYVVDGHVLVLDARDCSTLRAFDAPDAFRAAVANDGQVALFTGSTEVLVYAATSESATTLTLEQPSSRVSFTPDGRTLAGRWSGGMVGIDIATRAPSTLDQPTLALAFDPAHDSREREGDFMGGEHAIHSVEIRPDAEGIILGQRVGTFVMTRSEVRALDCIDGDQDVEWSPTDVGVVLQGEDGSCNVATGEGTRVAPEEGYGSYYAEESTGEEEEEEEEERDEIVCAPADATVCLSYPARGGDPMLVTGTPPHRQRLRGASDWPSSFSSMARYVAITSDRWLRVIDTATGRDRLRTGASEAFVEWSADDLWLVTNTASETARFHSLADVGVAFDVPHVLRPESVTFEEGNASALVCSRAGIERISLTSGALTSIYGAPCRTLRRFGDRVVVRGDAPGLHLVDLASGSVLLDIDENAVPPPAGSPYFTRCEGRDRTLFDIVRATRTVASGACGHRASAIDGRYWIEEGDLESLVLERPDGAHLSLRVVWTDGPHPFVEADDGAFWVASDDEVSELNVVVTTDEGRTVVSADDPEMRRRFYRPTLLADFLDGRPLPGATE